MSIHPPAFEHDADLILLAEDDEELRFILSRVLIKEGYRIQTVDSVEALIHRYCTIAAQPLSEREVKVVLSDIYMPGGSALAALAGLAGLGDIPIVLMTSAFDPEIARRAGALGVLAVLAKPIDLTELKQLLRDIIQPSR